ncbi:MAG: hypothetical protein R3F20_07000 [Planctomycetota bacterium]
MSEPDPLPDSNDPFEVLGLEPTADEREVRRAYAGLARRFKPERHPEQFQRLRRAYEAALDIARMQERFNADDDGEDEELEISVRGRERPSERETREIPTGGGEPAPGPSSVWRDYVETGRFDEAAERLEARIEAEPLVALHYLERFGLEMRRERPEEGMRQLARGIVADAALFPYVFQALSVFDRAALARRDEIVWPVLRSVSDRHGARFLFQERIEEFLGSGDTDLAFEEVEAPQFRRDAEDDPFLRRLAQRVAIAGRWWERGRAEALGAYVFTTLDDEYVERLYLEKGFRREDWRDSGFPEALDRYAAVYDVLSPDGSIVASMRFLREIREEPGGFAPAMRRLSLEKGDPPLVVDMVHALVGQGETEASSEAPDEECAAELRGILERGSWRRGWKPRRRTFPTRWALAAAMGLVTFCLIAAFARTTSHLLWAALLFPLAGGLLGWLYSRVAQRRKKAREASALAAGFSLAVELLGAVDRSPVAIASWLRGEIAAGRAEVPTGAATLDQSPAAMLIHLLEQRRRRLQGEEEANGGGDET